MEWVIYFAGIADGLVGIFWFLGLVLVGLGVLLTVCLGVLDIQPSLAPAIRRLIIISGSLALLLWLSVGFIPNSKTIAAAYVLPKIARNEPVHSSASGLEVLAAEWLKEMLAGSDKRALPGKH